MRVIQARRISATVQACAKHPWGAKGGSPSKISLAVTTATPLNRGTIATAPGMALTNNLGHATTGLVAPGIIWAGQYFQIGAEALVPYGEGQGHGIGGIVQFHLFLDDLFPNSIGRPLVEW